MIAKQDELISKLINIGYERVNKVLIEVQQGDIIDIFDVTAEKPVKLI
jgi:transcription-repair coupling factor (superfamily II helicase)